MEADLAHYLHASVYQFNEAACAAISQALQNALNDARVRCGYDVDLNLFHIIAPNELGIRANDHLTAILWTRIKQAADDSRNCLVEVEVRHQVCSHLLKLS
jgi:hypothetical protein